MLTYYLVLFSVLFFAGAAQWLERTTPPVTLTSRFSGTTFVHSKEVLRFYLISSLVLVCVAGLRFRVGTDFGAYFRGADDYANSLLTRIIQLDEPGYSVIASFCRAIGFKDGRGAIFLAAALTIGIVCFIFYKHSDQLLLVSLLYFLTFWTASFNGVRQSLAVSIIFCGYHALKDQKLLQYALWVALAWLFHHSAICMIVPYFFIYYKLSWKNLLLISFICIFVFSSYDTLFDFANEIMEKDYVMEEGSYMYSDVNILRVLSGLAPALYFTLPNIIRGKSVTREEQFCINILIMKGAVCLVCMHSPCFYRMAMYFAPPSILAIAYLIKTSSNTIRTPLTLAVCLLYLIFFFYETSNSYSLNHFHFIWDKSVWYPEMHRIIVD